MKTLTGRGRRTSPRFGAWYSQNSAQTLDTSLRVLDLSQERNAVGISRGTDPATDFLFDVAGWYQFDLTISALKASAGASDIRVLLYADTGSGFTVDSTLQAYGPLNANSNSGFVSLQSTRFFNGGDELQFQYISPNGGASMTIRAEGAQLSLTRLDY